MKFLLSVFPLTHSVVTLAEFMDEQAVQLQDSRVLELGRSLGFRVSSLGLTSGIGNEVWEEGTGERRARGMGRRQGEEGGEARRGRTRSKHTSRQR